MDKNIDKNTKLLIYLFFSICAVTGVYYEFFSSIISVGILCIIIYTCFKNNSLLITNNILSISLLCLPVFYIAAVFWAIDKGMAVWGFLKFIPVSLFGLLWMQLSNNVKEKTILLIPFIGAVTTIISYLLSFIPCFDGYCSVEGRLAGFWGYPNTYALFLLIGFIIVATSKKFYWHSAAVLVILLFGIFQTGSRTVFALLLLVTVSLIILVKKWKMKLLLGSILALGIVIAAIYAGITGNFQTIGRFLTSSFSSSTFLGRFLYARDVIPIILKNPFGLGYDGYRYIQSAIQTGVYTTRYIHNDFLQLMIDIGWIPTIIFIAAILKSFFKKGKSLQHRLIIMVICLHCLFDFSLQFIMIDMILVQMLEYGPIKEIKISSSQKGIVTVSSIIMILISGYFGMAGLFQHLGKYQIAAELYPAYTDSYFMQMIKEPEIDQANQYAEKVLALNQNISQAYEIRALYAYGQGDFGTMIENKEKAIQLAPYKLQNYTEYIDMLMVGIQLYQQAEDFQSMRYCAQRVVEIPGWLDTIRDNTSDLAWKIVDKPQLELPEEYDEMISTCQMILE